MAEMQLQQDALEAEFDAPRPVDIDSSPAPSVHSDDGGDDDDDDDYVGKCQDFKVIWLRRGREPIYRDGVTNEILENLRDLVYRIKKIHFAGSDIDKLPKLHDIRKLLDLVFSQSWIPGKPHQMCSKDRVNPGMDDVLAQIGLFAKNIGASTSGLYIPPKDKNGSGRRSTNATSGTSATSGTMSRKKIKKLRSHPATAHLVQRSALKRAEVAHSKAREAKKPVYVGCRKGKEPGMVVFDFYDSQHRMLPSDVYEYVTNHVGFKTLSEARGHSMQLHDRFKLRHGREYNIRLAVFIARNRLTHWANGNHVDTRPRGEAEVIDHFIPYLLMRNMDHADKDALAVCRAVVVPKLWDDMDNLSG